MPPSLKRSETKDTPPPSTRQLKDKAKSSRGKGVAAVPSGSGASASASGPSLADAAKEPSLPSKHKSSQNGPNFMKAKTGKRTKQSREERLQEAIDYGTEGGWTMEKWIQSLQVHKLVAEALADGVDESGHFDQARGLTREEVARRLGAAKLEGLSEVVLEGVDMLQEQEAATGAELNHKFHVDGAGFEMSFGSLELFFGGLEGIIGPPRLIKGSLIEAMRQEHTLEKDSQVSFKSSNGVSTTSETEWEFVHEPDMTEQKVYPERGEFRTPSGQEIEEGKCRKKRPVALLKGEMEEIINSKLIDAGHTQVIVEAPQPPPQPPPPPQPQPQPQPQPWPRPHPHPHPHPHLSPLTLTLTLTSHPHPPPHPNIGASADTSR